MTQAQIAEKCKHLRARAPQEWDEFVKMFAEYTAEVVSLAIEADAASIMEAKGFALANKGWLHTFTHLDPPPPSTKPQSLSP